MRTAILFAGMMIANAIGKGELYLDGGSAMKFMAWMGVVCILMDIASFIKEMMK